MAFSLTERDVDWLARAPVKVESEVMVHASAERVFNVLADHEAWPGWFPGIRRVRIHGRGSGIGAARTVWLGPVRAEERFLIWEPGKQFSFFVAATSLPGLRSMVEDWRLEAVGPAETRVWYRMGIEAAGPLRFADRLLRPGAQRALSGALQGLAGRFT